MLWLWIFGSAVEVVEVVVVDVMVHRWLPGLRIPLLIIGIWGFLWTLDMYAAYRVRHVVMDTHLTLRGGLRPQVVVPLEAVDVARTAEHELPGITKTLHSEDGLLLLGVSSRTNVELVLHGAVALATSQGEMTADRVGLWADEPREVARMLGQRLPTSHGIPGDRGDQSLPTVQS
ncbi:hypothetical protein [Nocardioides jensenii]|uniref:hypothetical protein n=1 Tax=Nocardioides jensenii TaxID=1843 RepID=UPI0008359C61|nr:hypothetical protein [Nocardioides jensenii]